MTEQNTSRKEMLEEIVNRKNLGDKKFHSETSLQKFGEDGENEIENESRSDENDPGVCIFLALIILFILQYNIYTIMLMLVSYKEKKYTGAYLKRQVNKLHFMFCKFQ